MRLIPVALFVVFVDSDGVKVRTTAPLLGTIIGDLSSASAASAALPASAHESQSALVGLSGMLTTSPQRVSFETAFLQGDNPVGCFFGQTCSFLGRMAFVGKASIAGYRDPCGSSSLAPPMSLDLNAGWSTLSRFLRRVGIFRA